LASSTELSAKPHWRSRFSSGNGSSVRRGNLVQALDDHFSLLRSSDLINAIGMPDCDSSAQPNQEYDFMASIKRFRDCSAIGF